jgi:predicted aconitase
LYLTCEEERILKGEEGYAKQKAMEILTVLGDIYGADRLIPVSSAQIAGVSYTSLGDEGIEWLESLQDCRVVVPAMLNPASIDLENWMGSNKRKRDSSRKEVFTKESIREFSI